MKKIIQMTFKEELELFEKTKHFLLSTLEKVAKLVDYDTFKSVRAELRKEKISITMYRSSLAWIIKYSEYFYCYSELFSCLSV